MIVREFQVREGREREFEEVYGVLGGWSEFLAKKQGHVKSELRCESKADRRYRLWDFWLSHSDFERFRDEFQADLAEFNRKVEEQGLLEKEILLGSFYLDESGPEDEAGFVPA